MTADDATPSQDPAGFADGGCACGALRYRLLEPPMFVHCCHCTRCQRETGGPFAHHAVLAFDAMAVLQGEPEYVNVPTDSGRKHWVARCPACKTALWNSWGSQRSVARYLRVGTLDDPSQCPPAAHIYVRSKQPWLTLADGAPHFKTYYDSAKLWPQASQDRYQQAVQASKLAGKGRR